MESKTDGRGLRRGASAIAMCLVGALAWRLPAANPQLTWTGGGDGSTWSDVANWDKTPDWAVVNDIDFTAVAGGATIVNDATANFGTVTFGADKGVVAWESDRTAEPSSARIVVPAGTTLDANFQMGKYWGWTTWKAEVQGGGTLHISGAWQGSYASGSLTLDGVAAVMKKGMGANAGCDVTLRNGARLTAESDFTVGSLVSTDADVAFDLNGFSALLKRANGSFAGALEGAGTLTVQGGGSWTLSGRSPDFAGTLAVKTAKVDITGALGPNAKVASVDTGVLAFSGDASVAGLSGSAARGGVSIAEGRTLTVTYGGRYGAGLSGAGSFVFDGEGETLVLSGANSHTGTTEAKAGTLVVSDVNGLSGYPAGLVSRYSFDNDIVTDDLCANDLVVAAGLPTRLADGGVGGSGCLRFGGADAFGVRSLLKTSRSSFVKGKSPFTISFWIRTTDVATWKDSGKFVQMGTYNSDVSSYIVLGTTTTTESGYPDGSLLTLQGNWAWTGNWQDGTWRHFALTFDGDVLTLFVNGSSRETKEKAWDIAASSIVFGENVTADYDEILVFNRALTADEVKGLCNAPTPAPSATAQTFVPSPVAHWTFDDPDDPGRDASGNGCDLMVCGGTLELVTGADVCGRAARLTKDGAYLKRTEDGLPANFPTGGASFTVNVRVAGDGGAQDITLFSMGDVGTDDRSFRIGNGSYPRMMGYSTTGKNGSWTKAFESFLGKSQVDYTFVFDSGTGRMTCYRDGVETVAPHAPKTVPAIVADGTVCISYNPLDSVHFEGTLDDVQVFDVALDAGQVRRMVQSIGADAVPGVLPALSPVSVASGATLHVATPGVTAVAALAGAGTVSLCTNAMFRASAISNFTGTVVGTGAFALAEGGTLVCSSGAPAVDMAGELRLPSVATVRFAESGRGVAPVSLVARATRLDGATDLSGWTCRQGGRDVRTTFRLRDNAVWAMRQGLVIMIR